MALFAIVVSLFVSCDMTYEQISKTVSNPGTVTSSVVSGKSTLTIEFGDSASSNVADDKAKTYTVTTDTGRYDTLVKAFDENGLENGRKYPCSVTSKNFTAIMRNGENFNIYVGDKLYSMVTKSSAWSSFDSACTMTITYGDEDIITYPHLPTSPDGLPSGTLWNDNGVIKITS